MTVPIINNASATINEEQPIGLNTTEFYNVKYSFRIPYAYIDATAASDGIYKAALYSQIGSGTDGILAWFLFTDSGSYDPIVSSDWTGNFSIIIEWTMTLSNS